jgi:hypothetical protein
MRVDLCSGAASFGRSGSVASELAMERAVFLDPLSNAAITLASALTGGPWAACPDGTVLEASGPAGEAAENRRGECERCWCTKPSAGQPR